MKTKTVIGLIVFAVVVLAVVLGFAFFPNAIPDLMKRMHGG